MQTFKVSRVSDGLGFGDGSISLAALQAQAGDDAVVAAAAAIESQNVLVPVESDDDGCGDGRPTGRIFMGNAESGTASQRAKVFGGGSAMATAALIGLGKVADDELEAVFARAIALLNEKQLNFGAHTADHVTNEESCGCGAIDNAPAIIATAVNDASAITSTIATLGFETSSLATVLEHYAAYAQSHSGQSYSGARVMQAIRDENKVIKELTGAHLEGFIVLNTVPGLTVNQTYIREAAGGRLDVFATDVWRLQLYAERLFMDPAEQAAALLSELVYTLATAAVLTRGDLPVYVIS